MRVIKLKLLTQVSLLPITTDVQTLGQFKQLPEVQKLDLKWSNMKLIDLISKNAIDLDEATLPAGDCILFVTPTKTDSGLGNRAELLMQISSLKKSGITVNFNATQKSTVFLQEFIANTNAKVENPIAKIETKPEGKSVLQRVIILEEDVQIPSEEEIEAKVLSKLAHYITNDEMTSEANRLAKIKK